MGRPEAALKELEEAHRSDPDNLKIADALAQNYQELGQFQRSQEIYQEVLARHGDNRALQNNLCYSFYLQGNLSKAETCFEEALERDPGNLAARNNLGLLWCRQGKLAEAQRLWEEAEGAAGAQTRMNQALAFLGKAPANYAKLPEPQPQSQAAAPPPATVAPPAKPDWAAAQALVEEAPATPPAATAAKVAPPAALKPAEAKSASPAPAEATAASPAPAGAKPASPAPAGPASKPAAPVTGAAASKVAEAQAPPKAPGSTSPPKTVPMMPLKQATKSTPLIPPLTALERETTGIEVWNGNGTRNLARQTRTLLEQEGFEVSKIGNHINFAAPDTVIYYRPGAERVAQDLIWQIFPQAKLETTVQLKDGVGIKVLLGRDLLDQPLTMARIATAGSEAPLPAAQMTSPASQPQTVMSRLAAE
jgi:Flp pilus assembly protein TadD